MPRRCQYIMGDHDESPAPARKGKQGSRGANQHRSNPSNRVGSSTSQPPLLQDEALKEVQQEPDEDSDDVLLGIGYAGREDRSQSRRAAVCEDPEETATDEPEPVHDLDDDQDEDQGTAEEEEQEEVWKVCAGEAWEEGDILIEEAGDACLLHSRFVGSAPWRKEFA